MKALLLATLAGLPAGTSLPASCADAPFPLEAMIQQRSQAVAPRLTAWRRDIHQHPELGNLETRTAALVADHLRRLGLQVQTGVAVTGVVGLLKGGRPGPTVALRADMDALPITEPTDTLPFASRARGLYQGQEVGIMHACGHDAHTAMLMATAEILAGLREQLAGDVLFVFQPAEEGPANVDSEIGISWGARQMLEQGVFRQHRPVAVLGMHVMPGPSGQVSWREGATTASSDSLDITITGRQGHGGMPWDTVDPIATTGLVLTGLQTVVSRQTNLTQSPAVVSIGTIHGGTRENIIPESVTMRGTIRTYDEGVRGQVAEGIRRSVGHIAQSTGAQAEVRITPVYPTTVNDAALAQRLAPVIQRAANGKIATAELPGASEDFSYLAAEVPGLFVFLGITPDGSEPVPNHNPRFVVDEPALVTGTRVMASMAAALLQAPARP